MFIHQLSLSRPQKIAYEIFLETNTTRRSSSRRITKLHLRERGKDAFLRFIAWFDLSCQPCKKVIVCSEINVRRITLIGDCRLNKRYKSRKAGHDKDASVDALTDDLFDHGNGLSRACKSIDSDQAEGVC